MGMAELADAPDLGIRNQRFQNIAFHFKKAVILREEIASFPRNWFITSDE